MKTIFLFVVLSVFLVGFTGCCTPGNRCWNCFGGTCSATSSAGELANGPDAPGIPMR
ncbi:MAG: hypothetical protein AB7U73_17365 [Pirellulales bacterium]